MYVDYPRCPVCQWSLVKCKRYSSLIKKIHNRLGNIHSTVTTLSGSGKLFLRSPPRLTIKDVKLPEQINAIIKRNDDNSRQHKLIELFVHVVGLFQKLSCQIDTERDRLLQAIYEHVEKNNSLFLTRQQWSDLENEYNRLTLIDRFRISQELLGIDSNKSEIETLNDILFGPNQFSQLACLLCNVLLNHDSNDGDDEWKSILLDGTKWDDFEKDRFVCDGKWVVCPKGEEIDL
jgi:hypothetical protein